MLRRSIAELCAADHGDDPNILARWLHNKTPDNFVAWIARPDSSVLLGAGALAFMGVSKPAKAFEGTGQQNPLLGLWDMTIPVQVGLPIALYFKFAISEGGFVVTGNDDVDAAANGGFTYSPGMGTYTQTGHNSYPFRQRNWAMDASGNPAGSVDTTVPSQWPGTGRPSPGRLPLHSTISTATWWPHFPISSLPAQGSPPERRAAALG